MQPLVEHGTGYLGREKKERQPKAEKLIFPVSKPVIFEIFFI